MTKYACNNSNRNLTNINQMFCVVLKCGLLQQLLTDEKLGPFLSLWCAVSHQAIPATSKRIHLPSSLNLFCVIWATMSLRCVCMSNVHRKTAAKHKRDVVANYTSIWL